MNLLPYVPVATVMLALHGGRNRPAPACTAAPRRGLPHSSRPLGDRGSVASMWGRRQPKASGQIGLCGAVEERLPLAAGDGALLLQLRGQLRDAADELAVVVRIGGDRRHPVSDRTAVHVQIMKNTRIAGVDDDRGAQV